MVTQAICSGDVLGDGYAMARIDFRARQLAKRLKWPDERREDCVQDMVVELLSAFKRFDPAKSSRETFINRALDRYMKYLLRREYTRLYRSCTHPISLDDGICRIDPVGNDPRMGELDKQGRTELRLDLAAIIAQMPKQLQRVCRVLMEVGPIKAIERLGTSRTTLYRHVAEIREHLKLAGFDLPKNGGTDWRRLQM